MKNNFFASIVVAVAITVVSFMAFQFGNTYLSQQKDLTEKQTKQKMVAECIKAGSVTWTDKTTLSQTTEPFEAAYKRCLQDSGYYN